MVFPFFEKWSDLFCDRSVRCRLQTCILTHGTNADLKLKYHKQSTSSEASRMKLPVSCAALI